MGQTYPHFRKLNKNRIHRPIGGCLPLSRRKWGGPGILVCQGMRNGGQVLGYDVDPDNPGVPTINDDEKALVRLIFDTYIIEKGIRKTAEAINKRGYRTKSYTSRRGNVQGGKKFTDTIVSRVLQNPQYVGKVRHNGDVFEGQHEPMIPEEIWTKVQRMIQSNQGQRRKTRPQNLHAFALQGLVRCGSCGSFMTPYYGYGRSKPYFYYACTRHVSVQSPCREGRGGVSGGSTE